MTIKELLDQLNDVPLNTPVFEGIKNCISLYWDNGLEVEPHFGRLLETTATVGDIFKIVNEFASEDDLNNYEVYSWDTDDMHLFYYDSILITGDSIILCA